MSHRPTSPMTFLSLNDWNAIESVFYGSSAAEYFRLNEEFSQIITEICKHSKCLNYIVIGTALVYFHKYNLVTKNHFESEFDKYLVATACVFIASKSRTQLIHVEDLIFIMLNLFYKDDKLNFENLKDLHNFDDAIYQAIKEKVFSIELDILSSLGFDLYVELPYHYLLKMKSLLDQSLSHLFNYSWRFLNDSFTLPLCLYYHPLHIALATIHVLHLYYGVSLPKEWHKLIDSSIELEDIENISQLILLIYKYAEANLSPSVRSEVKSENKKLPNQNNTFPKEEQFISSK